MRPLIILLTTIFLACTPCDNTNNPKDHILYYPLPAQTDTIVGRIHLQYDTYRAEKHDIPLSLAKTIRKAAESEGIPVPLAFSLVQYESSFQVDAVSNAGAVGLSQVMPATGLAHCGLSHSQLFNPNHNLPCGLSYLRMLYDRYSDWSIALAAYNVGDARRKRAHLTGEPDGSGYAFRVLSGS